MRRSSASIAVALSALCLMSAAAQARRSTTLPLTGTRSVEPASQRGDDSHEGRGVALSLGWAEQGRPFAALPALRISNAMGTAISARLYDARGGLDLEVLSALDELLADVRDPAHVHRSPIDRRTVQLFFRAAYHFGASSVQVVSAYRRPGRRTEGYHAEGKAIDFRLVGVKAAALAAYLRTSSRVGVGVYTHARTQYVHLDVRDTSYYWLDASPPGRRWRERALRSSSIAARDAGYRVVDDWPEGTVPLDLSR